MLYSYTWQILRVRGLGPVLLRGLYGLQECVLCSNKLENISVQTLIALLFSFSRKKTEKWEAFCTVYSTVYICVVNFTISSIEASRWSHSRFRLFVRAHCPQTILNFHIKTEPVTVGADATVGKWAFFSLISLYTKRLKESLKTVFSPGFLCVKKSKEKIGIFQNM